MQFFKPIFSGIRWPFKKLRILFKKKAGILDIPAILPYRGYGDQTRIFISGRVLESRGLSKPAMRQSVWKNIIATIKRYTGDDIAGVKVEASYLGETVIDETDELGFFYFDIRLSKPQKPETTRQWNTVHFRLLDNVVPDQPEITATGEVRIIPRSTGYIFISDIDDTVMISHSTKKMKKIRLLLFRNAYTRLPFTGVASLYQALSAGKDGKASYPFFYVSSSEWNLYDLLDDFFRYNRIPEGIFMLRTLNHSILKIRKSGGGNHMHKYDKIKSLMEFYPRQKFILFGDNGQKDPEIYYQLALQFPGRIPYIYIRRVVNKPAYSSTAERYSKMAEAGTSFLEITSSTGASAHALKNGYINRITEKDEQL